MDGQAGMGLSMRNDFRHYVVAKNDLMHRDESAKSLNLGRA
jgi:hypothetical protein